MSWGSGHRASASRAAAGEVEPRGEVPGGLSLSRGATKATGAGIVISSIRIVASPAVGGNRLCCCQCTQELRCFRPNWRFAGAGLGDCGRCVRGRRLGGGGRARRVFIGSSRHGDGTTMPPRAKARRHHGPVLPRSSARSGGCKLHERNFFLYYGVRSTTLTARTANNKAILARGGGTGHYSRA